MRVNNPPSRANDASIASAEAAKMRDSTPKPAGPKHNPKNPDDVKLSRLSQALSTTDDARVEKLRAAVASGSYSVSSREISANLIDEHIANSGRQS